MVHFVEEHGELGLGRFLQYVFGSQELRIVSQQTDLDTGCGVA